MWISCISDWESNYPTGRNSHREQFWYMDNWSWHRVRNSSSINFEIFVFVFVCLFVTYLIVFSIILFIQSTNQNQKICIFCSMSNLKLQKSQNHTFRVRVITTTNGLHFPQNVARWLLSGNASYICCVECVLSHFH